MNHFYKDLIGLEGILQALDSLDLTAAQKDELIKIAEETIHHAILDMLLSELKDEHKRELLVLIVENEYQKIWEHLGKHIENSEEKIKEKAKEIEKQLLDDIEELFNR